MTLNWSCFAAQKTIARTNVVAKRLLNLPLFQEEEECFRIILPGLFPIAIGPQHLLRRCEQRLMYVVHRTNRSQKERKIVSPCKTCELTGIVQSDINDSANTGFLQSCKESLGRCPGK